MFRTKPRNNIELERGAMGAFDGWFAGRFVLCTRPGVGRASLLGPGGFPQQVTTRF